VDVFLHECVTGETTRVSESALGAEANGASEAVRITGDGRYLVFSSFASNLVLGDTNGTEDVFLRNRETGETEIVSVSSTGELGNGDAGGSDDIRLAITPDARYVGFESNSSNLVPGDTNLGWDVFVRDRLTGVTQRVSVASDGSQGDTGLSLQVSLTPDAQYIAFMSLDTNLVPGRVNDQIAVYVRDLRAPFMDVSGVFWALSQIEACVEAGIVGGYPDGSYKPGLAVTRDQMAVFISRALAGGDSHIPTGPPLATFPDVPTGYWAFKYVEYAVDNGVTGGYPDGTYRPTVTVTRDQMAVFMARAMVGGDAHVPTGPATAFFPDVATDHWAFKYVEYVRGEGVTGGYPDGTYRPLVACTRDQMAVFVQRAFELPM